MVIPRSRLLRRRCAVPGSGRRSDDVKIEKGVPLPRRDGKYPFAKMEVGDSFAVEIENENTPPRVSSYAHIGGKRLGMKFTVRSVVENGKKVIRVWRVT